MVPLPLPLAFHLAATLSDIPRWIETRAMLLSGRAEVTGGTTAAQGCVVKQGDGPVPAVAIVGRPHHDVIMQAVEGITPITPVIGQVDDARWIQDALSTVSTAALPWRAETVVVHSLDDPDADMAPVGQQRARLLRTDDALDHLPEDLRREMTRARIAGPVAAVFVDGLAASLCYPCWRTETLWDVSVDTLEAHRGRSLAVAAVCLMKNHMRRDGRAPVWGALESNRASLRLAARLGFVPVDRIVVFSRRAPCDRP